MPKTLTSLLLWLIFLFLAYIGLMHVAPYLVLVLIIVILIQI